MSIAGIRPAAGPNAGEGIAPSPRWASLTLLIALTALTTLLYGLAAAAATLAPYLAAANVTSVVFERTGCYGVCPAYRFTFSADGRARYEGESFVRELGTYEADFHPRGFARFADALGRRGMFASRSPNVAVEDAPLTSISVRFLNGTRADTSAYVGFENDAVSDDMYVSGLFIDGFAAHICGWHRIGEARPGVPAGSYSPISTSPCTRLGDRRVR